MRHHQYDTQTKSVYSEFHRPLRNIADYTEQEWLEMANAADVLAAAATDYTSKRMHMGLAAHYRRCAEKVTA